MARAAVLPLLLLLPGASPLPAQLGQTEVEVPGALEGTGTEVPLPPADLGLDGLGLWPSTRMPYSVAPAGRVATGAEGRREILEPDAVGVLRVLAEEGSGSVGEVVFETPGGSSLSLAAERRGPDLEVRFRVPWLLEGAPETGSGGFALFKTTESRDSEVLREGLPLLQGAAGAPSREVSFVEDLGPLLGEEEAEATRFLSHYGGAALVEAGGATVIPFRVRFEGREPFEGAVAVAGRARWMAFSGHYPAGEGGYLLGSAIHPRTIEGRGWPDHLEVLLFSACYAGEVAGQPVQGERLFGRGVDGASWWDKFRGTLLGYRGPAPTQAAPAVNRRFLREISRVPSSGDRETRSREIAQAWMRANWAIQATFATAIDASGRYYYFPQAGMREDIPCAPRLAGVPWRVAPRSCWESLHRDLLAQTALERSFLSPLLSWISREHGGRPPPLERLVQVPFVRSLAADTGTDLQDEETRARLQRSLRYQEHLFFETDVATIGWNVLEWIRRNEGPEALTYERFEAFRQPELGREVDYLPWPRATVEGMIETLLARPEGGLGLAGSFPGVPLIRGAGPAQGPAGAPAPPLAPPNGLGSLESLGPL